jgi:hypothetical protein
MQRWNKIAQVLTTNQLHHMYAAILIPGCGTISCNREKNLKILDANMPEMSVDELYRINSIGRTAVRNIVGLYYRDMPNCRLVTSFFRRG